MKSHRKRQLSAMILTVIIAVVALTVWRMNHAPAEDPFPPLPNPNGYTALLQGAKQLRGDPPIGTNASQAAIQQYARDNQAIVDASRHALTLPSSVPVQFFPGYTSIDNLAHLKKLSQAFNVAADAALLNTNLNAAVSYWTDSILLGQRSAAGGLVIDALLAASVQRKALQDLRQQFPSLNTPQLRRIIVALDSTIRQEEPPEDILLREKEWARKAYGLKVRIAGGMQNILSTLQGRATPTRRMRRTLREKDSLLRLTLLEASLHLYKQENGSFPASLDRLNVYLPILPTDPFSGDDFIYRLQGDNYRLYSVGPDGVDNDGKLYTHRSRELVPKGDFAFDMDGN